MGKHGAVLSWNPCLLETYKQEWISGQRALQRSQRTQPGSSLAPGCDSVNDFELIQTCVSLSSVSEPP